MKQEISFDNLPQAVSYLIEKVESLEKILQAKTEHSNEPTIHWFNLEELREYLPDKPAKATIYCWVSSKQIPYHKNENDKRLRFLKSEIDKWLSDGKRKSESELQEEAQKYLERKKGGFNHE